jgi:hypothetical protein
MFSRPTSNRSTRKTGWIVAGKSLAEQDKSSFCFDIRITDEPDGKAAKTQTNMECA